MITRESDAWFAFAERFEQEDHRNRWLCFAIHKCLPDASLDVALAMVARIRFAMGCNDGDFTASAYEHEDGFGHPEMRQARVLACLMFGWEARDAEKQKARRPLRRQRRTHLNKGGR